MRPVRVPDKSEVASQRPVYYLYLLVIAVAAAVYLGCIISPPSLMDDVDAVQAQIARNMLHSGDWVSARLDGVLYLEKAPLLYWLIAFCYKISGAYDWAARIPVALSAIGLGWLTAAFGVWAFGRRAGLYAGLCISTCLGLFLFTRILIPDVMITLTIALGIWSFLRAIDPEEKHQRLWAFLIAASIGIGLLLKSLIGAVFPIGTGLIYLLVTRQLFSREIWRRIRPFSGILIVLAIAAPWHILATLRNPPYFDLTWRSVPGEYHGFFWFYFMNEQVLRFLNLRYPRDYNTVPRLWFWLFHLVWLFPWSIYLPAVFKLGFRPVDRAGRARLLALCWIGCVLVFFTFSTTQEYYSMPCYPAFALLLGSAIATGGRWIKIGSKVLGVIVACAAVVGIVILAQVWNLPAPGDISRALSEHPDVYTLSLGHVEDLTLKSFAYLRIPLLVAVIAFALGAVGASVARGKSTFLVWAAMMVIFFQGARLALVVFDPYMSSRPLADAFLKSPPGEMIVDHHYYEFSSVFFYTDRRALLLNGRFNNLVYGSYAPGAPNVFIDNAEFKQLWATSKRYYVFAELPGVQRLVQLVGRDDLYVVATSGGKFLLTNEPLPTTTLLPPNIQKFKS
ncbi:MAG TPA: glycosyltransferase family 39 protein [Bryobacteraceae bacterium]|nr:glycosyltransferase family 39 protein [Bryobacteraceae bacterium]